MNSFSLRKLPSIQVHRAERVAHGLEPLRRFTVAEGVFDRGSPLKVPGRLLPISLLQFDLSGDEVIAHLKHGIGQLAARPGVIFWETSPGFAE